MLTDLKETAKRSSAYLLSDLLGVTALVAMLFAGLYSPAFF